MDFAFLDLARAYHNSDQDSAAYRIIEQTTDSAIKHQDNILYHCALELKTRKLIFQNRYEDAMQTIKTIFENGGTSPMDSLCLCYVMAYTGQPDKAMEILDDVSDDSSHWKRSIRYEIYKNEGNVEQALQELEGLDIVRDSLLRTYLSQNLTSSVVDHYVFSKKLTESELSSYRKSNWLIIFGGIIIVGLIWYFTSRIIRKQKSELEKKIILVEQLHEIVNNANKDSSNRSNELMRTLLDSKYEMFKEFSAIVLQSKDEAVANKKIAAYVSQLIKSLSDNGDKIEELERSFNLIYDNLFSDFRRDLPNLKDEDYRLYLFSILGFKSSSISLFLNVENVTSIHDRKRRLKDKIKGLEPSKRDRYLGFLR